MKKHAAILWKIPLLAVTYVVTFVASAGFLSFLEPEVSPAPDMTLGLFLARFVPAALIVAAALAIVAWRIRGRFVVRAGVLFCLFFVAYAINNSIEAYFFTTMEGIFSYFLPVAVLPSGVCAVLATRLFGRSTSEGALTLLREHAASRPFYSWSWRVIAAWLAFPVIYFIFGIIVTMIFPFVIEYYQEQTDLRIPGVICLLKIQHLRSALFVVAVIPVCVAWTGSRWHLAWVLGLSLFFLVGLAGLVQADVFTAQLRLIHGVEILADSLGHGAVLAVILGRPSPHPLE